MPAAPARKHHTDVRATQEKIYSMLTHDVFGDGSKQLVVLWDSWNWGAGASPTFATRPGLWKFCSLGVAVRPGVSPIRRRERSKAGCGADQPPCETASGFERLALCFCATSFAARTARSTVIGALWRTAGSLAGGRCSGTCCIWARSTACPCGGGGQPARCMVPDNRGVRRDG